MFGWISANSFYIDEAIYIICGIISIITGIRALKNKESKYGTFAFWVIVGIVFGFGGFIIKKLEHGGALIGALLFVLAALTLTKQVKVGDFKVASDEERRINADKLGNLIFIPSVLLGVLAVFLYEFRKLKIVIGEKDGKELFLDLQQHKY